MYTRTLLIYQVVIYILGIDADYWFDGWSYYLASQMQTGGVQMEPVFLKTELYNY